MLTTLISGRNPALTRLKAGWRAVVDYVRPRPIASAADLKVFLDREAAHLGQYSTHEFSRNTLGYFGQDAWRHPVFKERMVLCRWEAFAAVLADLIILSEGRLRQHVSSADLLTAPLVEIFASILGSHPIPAHRPEGWAAEIDQLRVRLGQAQMKPPSSANEIARVSARRVFDVLPVFSGNTEVDYFTIENAIRFGTVGVGVKLDGRMRGAAVARDLTGQPP